MIFAMSSIVKIRRPAASRLTSRLYQPVIDEFLKSHGDGCLKESATVLLPPI
jgi:hypothetical protein